MTQAFNLSQLANNLNTSGQLDATDGLTGAVPVANGGTGLTSVGTSGNVLTSNGTAWVSSAPSGGVTSLNGQTGAITNTSFNSIGSYVIAGYSGSDLNTNSSVAIGTTVVGSTLYKQNGNTANLASASLSSDANNLTTFTSTYYGGVTSIGATGTWRIMTFSQGALNSWGQVAYPLVLAVRIS